MDPRPQLDRDADQLADHVQREQHGEFADQIELVAVGDPVEQFPGAVADERLQFGDPPDGEDLVQQPAMPGVFGRVLDDEQGHDRFASLDGDATAAAVGVGVEVCGGDVVVAGQCPEALVFVVIDRRAVPQFAVDRVGIEAGVPVVGIELDHGHSFGTVIPSCFSMSTGLGGGLSW